MLNRLEFARSPDRNNAKDFIEHCIDGWAEIHGDRLESDDPSVICGFGLLKGRTLAIAAQYAGRGIEERCLTRNGMTQPSGYRKIHRLLQMAARFSVPLLCLIDTPGADSGVDACKQNQSKAIADTLLLTSTYPHPSIAIILNQGMSGGAMSLAMADRLWMMEHAVFSVISPEGCARILWHDITLTQKAAEMMKISARNLLEMGIIDEVIPAQLDLLPSYLNSTYDELTREVDEVRLERRYRRWDQSGE